MHQQAIGLLDGLHLRPIDAVLGRAAALDGPRLRSLDAIHLATEPPPTMVTYDQRLAEHATAAGLTVTAPN